MVVADDEMRSALGGRIVHSSCKSAKGDSYHYNPSFRIGGQKCSVCRVEQASPL